MASPLAGEMAVYRSVRLGGDTKTQKSRRLLKLPEHAVQALRELRLAQARERAIAGPLWQEHDLVFSSRRGTRMDSSHVRRDFKKITKAAGLGEDWTPRELRHTFVSLLSDAGVPLESIADAVGHSGTRTTETTYRHQIRPVIQTTAQVMDLVFGREPAELGS